MTEQEHEYDGPEPGAVDIAEGDETPWLSEEEAKAENEAEEVEGIETEVNTYG